MGNSLGYRFRFCVGAFLVWTWAFLFCLPPSYGQIVKSTLSGTVSDATGAGVPGASVTATNVATGIVTKTTSDATGYYILPALNAGNYTLSVEKAGFKATVISGIRLLVAQQAGLDAQLEVGALATKVEVKGSASMVRTTTSTLSTVVGEREVVEMPLNLRRFEALALLVPGTVADNIQNIGSNGAGSEYGSTFGEAAFDANGNRNASNNVSIDGMVSRELLVGALGVSPPPDAIQEFSIQTNIYNAAFGKSAGSTVNIVTKSGTNEIHGGVYDFLRNQKLDARNFFATNQTNPVTGAELPGTARPQYQRNQFGADVGGPIRKNKTFFFAYYEGLRETKGLTILNNVPTAAEKQGDFSSFLTGTTINLCGAGGPTNLNYDSGQIFDPGAESLFTCPAGSAKAGSSVMVGAPISGNLIKTIDPVAQKFMPYWPTPNHPGSPNFIDETPRVRSDNQFGVRLDHTISAKDQLFGRYTFGQSNITDPSSNPYTTLPGFSDILYFRGQNVTLSWIHAFSQVLLNEARIGFQRNWNNNNCEKCPYPAGFAEGFGVKNLVAVGQEQVPFFSFSNFAGVGDSQYRPVQNPDMLGKLQDNLTWTHGRHLVVAGADLQWWDSLHAGSPSTPTGTFYFNGQYSALAGAMTGLSPVSDLVDGLLGYPNGAENQSTFSWDTIVGGTYHSFYVQDDFRATPNLSLNLGFRWEYRGRPHDKTDRLGMLVPLGPKFQIGNATQVSALPDAPNDAICTTYPWLLSSDGRCLIASSAERAKLGLEGGNRPSLQFPYYSSFAPRAGISWRPTHSNKAIIHSGYGIFIDSPNTHSLYPNLSPWYTAVGNFSYPFGSPPVLTDGQLTTTENVFLVPGIPPLTNQYINEKNPIHSPNPYVQQWSFGVESQLGENWAVEVDYVGNIGLYLSRRTRNQPLPGLGPVQPRRAYPDYGQTGYPTMDAQSSYQSLQAKLTKRMSHGQSFLLAYTYAKNISTTDGNEGSQGGVGNNGVQDANDPQLDRARSYIDARQRGVFSYIWQLPVGKGKRYLNGGGVADAFLGDWEFSGIASLQSGFPLSVRSPADYSNTQSANPRPDRTCNGAGPKTVSNWFDTSCFTVSALEAALTAGTPRFGNSGRNILDGPALANWDFGLLKNFKLGERFQLQFRAEFYDATNHPYFGYPHMTIGSSTTGVISSQAGGPRDIQFGLKLSF